MPLKRSFKFSDARGGAAFTVRVVTRSATTEVAGVGEDGTLKIRLTSSPAGDPAANKELIDFLSSQLGVPKEKIEIVAGENGREKLVSVEGITTDEVETKLGVTEE